MTAEAVAEVVCDGATITFPGNASILVADHLLAAIERRFLDTGHPRELTVFEPCNAALDEHSGVQRFAHEGMLRRIIAAAYPSRVSKDPKLARLILDERVEAYMFPMGVLYNLLRTIGGGRPGLLTDVGIGTFADPLHGGGRLNARTTEDLVERVSVAGRETLYYRAMPIHLALLKATTADTAGNLTMEKEPLTLNVLSLALAAKASGGRVYAQVERIAEAGSLHPHQVKVPGALVDGVVLAPDAPQSRAARHDASITGELRVPLGRGSVAPGPDRIILARAACALRRGWLINLGVGTADALPRLLREAGCDDLVCATTEHGAFGGLPAQTPIFGAHYNAEAVIDPADMVDLYTGGVLDATYLGMAEADAAGNINVSRFGERIAGAGGFVDITFRTPRIFICGTFAGRGARLEIVDGHLRIAQEGSQRKLVERVQHVTLSGQQALDRGQQVTLITERAVFTLERSGWLLREAALGIDLQRDLQPMMGFALKVAPELRRFSPEMLLPAGDAFSTWLRGRIEAPTP